MAQSNSEFPSTFETVLEIWKRIVGAVLALGGNDEDMHRILRDERLAPRIATTIVGARTRDVRWFILKPDLVSPLDVLLASFRSGAGSEGFVLTAVDLRITTDDVQLTDSQQRHVVPCEYGLFSFKPFPGVAEVLRIHDQHGWEPATLRELLTLVITRPALQMVRSRIIALGTAVAVDKGVTLYPCLSYMIVSGQPPRYRVPQRRLSLADPLMDLDAGGTNLETLFLARRAR